MTTTTFDLRVGIQATPPGATFRDGWILADVADGGDVAVLGRRMRTGTEFRRVGATELAEARGLPPRVQLEPGHRARLALEPVTPGSFSAMRRAELDGARLLLFDGAVDGGDDFIGTERTAPARWRDAIDAALETLDGIERRTGRAGIDDAGGALRVLVNQRAAEGTLAEWDQMNRRLMLPTSSDASPSWGSPSTLAHELDGHATLLADAPDAHRLGGDAAREAAAVHEGWSDARGLFRTGSPAHGAGIGRDAHRLLDQSLMRSGDGWIAMPSSVDELERMRQAGEPVSPHRAGGIVSRAAWDMSQKVGLESTEHVFDGAQQLLRAEGGRLDFAGTGELLERAAQASLAAPDHAAVSAILRGAGMLR